MWLGIRFRRDFTSPHSKGACRRHCTNIVIGFGFVSMWTSVKGSCGILAWKIPRTEEPGGLLSMESQESDAT